MARLCHVPGMPDPVDAGPVDMEDAGGVVEMDSGPVGDAGRPVPRRDSGCSCATPGAPSSAPLLWLAVGLAWLTRRRFQ